jgi:hypothetical protein
MKKKQKCAFSTAINEFPRAHLKDLRGSESLEINNIDDAESGQARLGGSKVFQGSNQG